MLSSLLVSTAEFLRKDLKLEEQECSVQPTGQPLPAAGELFLSVWGTAWDRAQYHELNEGIAESFGLNVTITKRIRTSSVDRKVNEFYLSNVQSVEDIARQVVKTMMTRRYEILLRADEIMPGADTMVEPLRWSGNEAQPRSVGPDWFYATGDQEAGLAMDCRFSGAIRIQHFSVME